MPTKSVDIEVNLGVKDTAKKDRIDALAKARQIQDPMSREQATMRAKQAYERAQAKKAGADVSELEKAHTAELARARKKHEDRAQAQRERNDTRQAKQQEILQRRAAREQEKQSKLKEREEAKRIREEAQAAKRQKIEEAKAARVEERDWKRTIGFHRRWNKGVPLASIDELNALDEAQASSARISSDIRGDRFNPLGRPHSRTDLAHKASSEDRIQRGVKEAKEVEERLGKSRGGVGRAVSTLGQIPFAVAGAAATGHPAFIPALIAGAGKKLRDRGEEMFELNRTRQASGESLSVLQRSLPPTMKIAGAALMAYGAIGAASVQKRLEISQERAALEFPLARAAFAASEDVSYFVPGTRQKQTAKRLRGPGGSAAYWRTGAEVDPRDPRGKEDETLREQMRNKGFDMYRQFAERYGIAPLEAAKLLEQFSVQTGVPNSLTPESLDMLGQARLRGISVGSIASVARLAGPGGGSTYGAPAPGKPGEIGATLSRIIGTAESLGLTGARIDEYMARTAAATSQLAEKGFMLSVDGANELATALDQKGRSEAQGMGALRAAQRMQTLGPRTAQELGQQMFAPLARGVVLAKSMEGAQSLTEFFDRMSSFSKRKTGGLELGQAFPQYLGKEGGLMGLLGAGESLATARSIAETTALGPAGDFKPIQDRELKASLGTSRALANRSVDRLLEVSVESTEALVDLMGKLDQAILTFTDNQSVLIELVDVIRDAMPTLVDALR